MSIISNIAELDRKFAWSFFGFVLAVFFGGITVYNEFIKNPNPSLSVQILSDTNVLDVRENVPELKIVYGDVDIKSLNQTLSVVVFKVQNLGGAPILNSYYEEKAVPTLNLTSGKFIKVEQVGATNDYLTTSAQPVLVGQSNLQLPKVILEPGESYTLKALLLHGPRSGLPFKATGKVAGTKEIPVVAVETEGKKESFWLSVVSGSPSTQLARAPVYFFGFFLLLFFIGAPIAFVSDRVQAFSRRRTVKQFKRHYSGEIAIAETKVLGVYQKDGLSPLVRTREVVGDEVKLKRVLMYIDEKRFNSHGPLVKEDGIGAMYPVIPGDEVSDLDLIRSRSSMLSIRTVRELNIATMSADGACVVDKDLEKFLTKFIDFVNIKQS
ncbi:MAG: hypothetical protein IPN53_08935 [Comamonadaceae bacterium]|nr:hypothetical protein [Comamonadaceae bacterium]